MAIAAGQMSRKIGFRRQGPMPSDPGQPRAHVAVGAEIWGHYKDARSKETTIGSFQLWVRSGVLTVRDSALTRSFRKGDQAVIEDVTFELIGRMLNERPVGNLRLELQQLPGRQEYDEEIDARGEIIILRRIEVNAPARETPVRAIVTGYQPDELVGGISQGERKVMLSASDLEAEGFPAPRANDKLVVRGKILNILHVDDSTHRVAGVLNAYQIRATG